jgi:protocatechuate 3,4-dioxygenase beta subunit
MKIHSIAFACLILLGNLAWGATSRLTGTINEGDGKPLSGATVQIWTAGMKVGTSIFCPSCYVDCGKSSKTDAAGHFSIADLDPQLLFRVLVVREGYVPQFLTDVNPDKGPITASLKLQSQNIDSSMLLKGTVVDRKGKPVAGATVSPFGAKDAGKRWWGNTEEVADPLAVTNERGEFLLVCKKPGLQFDLQVEARSCATVNFELRPAGAAPVVLEVGEGATISGHLLDRLGKPIAGATIGLVQEDKRPEVFTGHHEVATDTDGQFGFYDIGPAGDYAIFATMSSMADKGAPKLQHIKLGGDGFNSSSTVLLVASARSISGKIVTSDKSPIPPGTRVMLNRDEAWDSLQCECDGEGNFHFAGVPPGETITIGAQIKGYHVSSKNKSFEPLNADALIGAADQNISGLQLLMEPGPDEPARSDPKTLQGMDQLKSSRITGIEEH